MEADLIDPGAVVAANDLSLWLFLWGSPGHFKCHSVILDHTAITRES